MIFIYLHLCLLAQYVQSGTLEGLNTLGARVAVGRQSRRVVLGVGGSQPRQGSCRPRHGGVPPLPVLQRAPPTKRLPTLAPTRPREHTAQRISRPVKFLQSWKFHVESD